MTDHKVIRDGVTLHARTDGPDDGPTLVFSNSLGTTLQMWDAMIAHLPKGLRLIRYDMRGHGLSDVPPAPYAMGAMVADAEAICDQLHVRDALFVGLSVGGMIAQGLAVKRLDLIRALVLSNTAAKIGTKQLWHDRIATVERDGMAALAPGVMDRWFGPDFRNSPDVAPWQHMLATTDPTGYAGVCAAIAGTDFITPTSGLRLPTLGIAGAEDRATPPDLVRETLGLIPGSDFQLLRRAGHLPCVEQPAQYAALLTDFMTRIGHLAP